MATRRSQRIGIWIIAGVMMLGTVGGFIAMMVAPGNEAKDKAALDAEMAQWNKAQDEYQRKLEKQQQDYQNKQDKKAIELRLSDKYFGELSSYSSRASKFKADEVEELKTDDLKVGSGDEIKEDTRVAIYYIGWNPSGKIFDQSIDGKKLKTPLAIDGPAEANVISGWRQGLVGMKVGGVRELTIPSDLAYGEQGMGEDIPADTPLKFVVMAIPPLLPEKPAKIKEPEMPPLVRKEYQKYGIN